MKIRLLLLLALAGCTAENDETATDAEPVDAADRGPVDAAPMDAEPDPGPDGAPPEGPLTVLFADAEDAWLTADDGRAPYVWGFQGGTMVRPVIVIDHPDFSAGQDIFVQIEHAPDPDSPDAYLVERDFERFTLELPLQQTPSGLATGPLDDQLAWDELDGSRLRFTATVEGLDAVWSRPLELYLHAAGPHPCDPISVLPEGEGNPCRIAVYTHEVRIDDVQPEGDQCAPLRLTGDFVFEPVLGDTCASRLGLELSWFTDVEVRGPLFDPAITPRCAADLGIEPGAVLPGELRMDYGLGCDPRPRVVLDVDTAACRCP